MNERKPGMRRAVMWGVAISLIGAALVLATAAISSAQDATGTPTIYKVTVKKVEFSSDGGTTFITLREADQEMDIASVNAGAAAANYASGLSLTPASYNRVRVTISCTIKLRGSVAFAGTTYYTTSAGGTSTSAGNLAEGSFTIPASAGCSGGTLTSTETLSFTVIQDQPKTVNVDFNVTGAIRLDVVVLSPNTVSVTYSTQ